MFLLFVSSELKYFVEKKITVSDSQLYHLDLQIWSICMGTGVNTSPLIPEHMTCFMQMGSSHISLQRGAIWWIYFWRWIEFYALRYFFCVPFVYYPTAYSWTLCCSLQSCYYSHLLLVPGIVLPQSIIHHHFILIYEICLWSPGMGCYFW